MLFQVKTKCLAFCYVPDKTARFLPHNPTAKKQKFGFFPNVELRSDYRERVASSDFYKKISREKRELWRKNKQLFMSLSHHAA